MANIGDVVTDIPGESIGWLLTQGFISPVAQPDTAPVDAPTDEVVA